jgi:hypothetical protein
MNQDIIDIDCNASEASLQPFTEESLQPLQSFTAKQLADQLAVSERSVYGYATKIIDAWHWLPESDFRADGIYTAKALTEMRRLQACKNSGEYVQMVAGENQKPIAPSQASKASSALAIPTRHTEALESKLAIIQRNIGTTSLSIQDRIATIKEQIAAESSRTKKNSEVLEDAEAQQAIARGIEKGMKLFQLEEQAKAAVLEQLQLEKLQQQ